MDTLLGILRGAALIDGRTALIDASRPDRGYAAIDRTRAFGTRVGRGVGGLRIYIEQIAAVASALLRVDRHCLFVIRNGPVDLAQGLEGVAAVDGSKASVSTPTCKRFVDFMRFSLRSSFLTALKTRVPCRVHGDRVR